MSDEIKVVKSWREGHVRLRASASASDMSGGSAKAEVGLHLPVDLARKLIADLLAAVEFEEAKVAKKLASEARRKVWRDREVAAGRMKLFSTADFFRR